VSSFEGVRACLGARVWPVYVGATNGHPGSQEGMCPLHEPYGVLHYDRGQITWERQPPTPDCPEGPIVGKALIYVPAGVYTHFAFCSGFQQAALMGARQMAHPVVFDRWGVIDLNPITDT
jgi:hypothetical protein